MASIRDYSRPSTIALIAVGLIVPSTAQRSWSQQPDPYEEFLEMFPKARAATAAFKEVKSRSEPVAGDDAHQTLLRLRLGAAVSDAEPRFRGYFAGTRGRALSQLFSALHLMSEAELALVDNAADRVSVHNRLADIAGVVESICKMRVDVGQIAEHDWLLARQFCAACELAAIEARRNPPKPAPKRPYPPPTSDFAPDTIARTMEQGIAALRQLASDELSVSPGLADNERKKLLNEQRATLHLELALRIRIIEFGGPNSGVDTLFGNDLLLNLSKNELALDDRPSNQLRIAERDLVLAKMMEAIAKKLNETSGVPWNRQRYDRLSAELKLMELRQAFPGVAASKPRRVEGQPAAAKTAAESNPFALTEAERAELSKLVVVGEHEVTINSELINPIFTIVSVEPEPGDDEWRKLAKSRHTWARSELRNRLGVFQAGARGHTATDLVDAVQRFEESALALAKDSSKRTAIIECVSRLFRVVDLLDRQRVSVDLWMSRVARLDAQIRLLDERRK